MTDFTEPPEDVSEGSAFSELGESIFEKHGVVFLITGCLLASALIGGIYLARIDKENKDEEEVFK
jgi:NADH:ubiquinone oxidoreductase subunit 6 (subunit J)